MGGEWHIPPLHADEGRQRSRLVQVWRYLRFVPTPCPQPFAGERPTVSQTNE